MLIKYLFIFLTSFLYSQNIDMYISLIHEGQSEGVKDNISELTSKYPNNPGVLYVQALLTVNGIKSVSYTHLTLPTILLV